MRKKISQQGDEVNEKIDQHYDRVIQNLMEQKDQLKQQVCDLVVQKVKAISTQLEDIEYLQAEVLSTKELNDAVEKSSDQELLMIKKQVINGMQQINVKYKKVNLEPVQQATLEFVSTKSDLGLLCSTAGPDPYCCQLIDLPRYFIRSNKSLLTIITKDKSEACCSRGGSQVSVLLGGVNDTTQVMDNNDGSYMASFVPHQVGEVKLSVPNRQHIKGSPYNIIVKDYKSVKKPNKIVNNDGSMGQPWDTAFGKNGIWAVAD